MLPAPSERSRRARHVGRRAAAVRPLSAHDRRGPRFVGARPSAFEVRARVREGAREGPEARRARGRGRPARLHLRSARSAQGRPRRSRRAQHRGPGARHASGRHARGAHGLPALEHQALRVRRHDAAHAQAAARQRRRGHRQFGRSGLLRRLRERELQRDHRRAEARRPGGVHDPAQRLRGVVRDARRARRADREARRLLAGELSRSESGERCGPQQTDAARTVPMTHEVRLRERRTRAAPGALSRLDGSTPACSPRLKRCRADSRAPRFQERRARCALMR
ncbi:hypothetical protein PSP6_10005 [Paraburkholderia tropica]|nr:hypothetical protein PSP6_10005 [Paraburkholderia tropica]